jgi:DNA-binding NarL/FixJ family response regulator
MAHNGLIRVLLVDDNTLLIYTIRTLLEQYPNIEVVGQAINGEEAVVQAEQLQPHVIVMDINMPKMNGIAATRLIRANFPRIVVLGLTTNRERCFIDAMSEAGAVHTLCKENAVAELHGAIQCAVASVYPILILEGTPRPAQSLAKLARLADFSDVHANETPGEGIEGSDNQRLNSTIDPASCGIGIKMAKQILVLLVDDHAMVRQGLRAALKPYSNIAVIGEAEDGERAIVSVEKLQPDVIVMDIRLSRMDGVTATRLVKAHYPHMVIIGITAEGQDFHTHAMKRAGAFGALMKDNAVHQLYAMIQQGVAAVTMVLIQEEAPTAMESSDDTEDSAKPASNKPRIQGPDDSQ